MEFKIFNITNSTEIRTGKPAVRFSSSSGLISFSKEAGNILDLNENSEIELCLNEEKKAGLITKNWYFKVVRNGNGFKVRRKDVKSGFSFNSTYLVKQVLRDHTGLKSASFLISQTPLEYNNEKYWFIMTGNPLGITEIK